MKWAVMTLAILLMASPDASAQPPFGRQLHYAGTRVVGQQTIPVSIDVDIGRLDSERTTWIVISEREGVRDLGPQHVTLESTGIVESSARLTLEEKTVLEMVALQFEDMDGLRSGDHWARRDLSFRVRENDGSVLTIEVSRNGSWRGMLSYNSTIVAPISIELSGEVELRPLQFSARLVADSFQPNRN